MIQLFLDFLIICGCAIFPAISLMLIIINLSENMHEQGFFNYLETFLMKRIDKCREYQYTMILLSTLMAIIWWHYFLHLLSLQ